jgi:hypothetical protein
LHIERVSSSGLPESFFYGLLDEQRISQHHQSIPIDDYGIGYDFSILSFRKVRAAKEEQAD